MNSIEQQLERDISMVKEGVVVTPSDLDRARIAIDGRIATSSRHSLYRVGVAVAAVAAVAVVGVGVVEALRPQGSTVPAGPQPTVTDEYEEFLTGTAPTSALINGFWRVDSGTVSILFSENGSVQLDDAGQVLSSSRMTGVFAIDGSVISIDWNDGSPCSDKPLEMRASMPTQGTLHVVAVSPPSGKCSPFGPYRTTFEHVLPTARGLANMVLSTASGWEPLRDASALPGDWMAEGGGFVLEINPDGRYFVLDNSSAIVDAGDWSLQGSALSLTSAGTWTDCGEGDVLSFGSVEQTQEPGALLMRGDVLRNDCGGKWTPEAWILIPNTNTPPE